MRDEQCAPNHPRQNQRRALSDTRQARAGGSLCVVPTFRGRVQVTYSGAQASERGEPQAPPLTAQLRYDPGTRVLDIAFSQPLERFRTVSVNLLEGIAGTDGAPLKPWKLTFTLGG